MRFLRICLILSCALSGASANAQEQTSPKVSYLISLDEKIPIAETSGVRIYWGESCRKGKCEARRLADDPLTDLKPEILAKNRKNPSSYLCEFLHGTPETLLTEGRDEIEVCRFKDGSFLVSWDLIKKKFGKGEAPSR